MENPAGQIVGVVGLAVDISERRRLEEQLRQSQKMEAVGRLAGGVAHDFNNMLAVIIGATEMALERVPSGSSLRDDLEQIDEAARRSADLTRKLLGFSRKQIIEPKPVNLNDLVVQHQKSLGRLIGEDIEIRMELRADLWDVFMDPSQADQILANLSVNARDAIHGVGTVTIDTDNVVLDQDSARDDMPVEHEEYVMISFTDTGDGMDAETLEHIFEPFFTTKGIDGGTGLGLATVYGIVKQNDGVIDVRSEPGQGTTFRIYLPRYRGREEEEEKEERTEGGAPGGSETVLLVEDEEAILALIRRYLESQGYTVLVGRTPGEALDVVESHPGEIDLLLSDVVMPRMNGKQLEERLRQRQPGLRTLFMSGYTADVIARRGVLEEGVEFIQKPFTMTDLSHRVREVLDGG
jgi:nitrogen-specific signal transduction histidine kinase